MCVVTLFLVWWTLVLVGAESASGRARRIINGKPIYSHDSYNTNHFIRLTNTHRCTTAMAALHEVKNDRCFNYHTCGGSLVHPRFVVTACHCIAYASWYKFPPSQPSPAVPDLEPADIPTYDEFDGVGYVLRAFHPLQNAMTLWGGSPDTFNMTQKRHAAAFFPHHLCMQSQVDKYVEKWPDLYEWDVGLVKTCEPFKVDGRVIGLTPMLHGKALQAEVQELVRTSSVCLWAGWGRMLLQGQPLGGKDRPASILQHAWRYLECSIECKLREKCTLCSQHHGAVVSHPGSGDSGSPITCGSHVIGSTSRGDQNYQNNHTWHNDFPWSCIPYHFEKDFLNKLLKKNDNVFHWWNGKPVPLE